MNTVIYINDSRSFKVAERGTIGTIDLLTVLNTLKHGFTENEFKIDTGKKVNATGSCKITIVPEGEEGTTDILTGALKAKQIVAGLELVMVKYARELVGEVQELQGILKGKDLERYLDQMIEQNRAKGNKNN